MNIEWGFMTIIIISIICVTFLIYTGLENSHELHVEAFKSGLQQCVGSNLSYWAKECPNSR